MHYIYTFYFSMSFLTVYLYFTYLWNWPRNSSLIASIYTPYYYSLARIMKSFTLSLTDITSPSRPLPPTTATLPAAIASLLPFQRSFTPSHGAALSIHPHIIRHLYAKVPEEHQHTDGHLSWTHLRGHHRDCLSSLLMGRLQTVERLTWVLSPDY